MSLDSHDVHRIHTTFQPAAFQPVTFTQSEPAPSLAAPPSDPSRFRSWRTRQSLRLLAADVAVLAATASLAAAATWTGGGLSEALGTALVLLGWLGLLGLAGGYRVRGLQLKNLVRAAVIAGGVMLGATSVVGLLLDWSSATTLVLLTLPAGVLGLLAVRLSWYLMLRRGASSSTGRRHVVVLGETTKAHHVRNELLRPGGTCGYVVSDVITFHHDDAGDGAAAVARARDAVLTSGADLVILAGADVLDPAAIRGLAWELADLDVELATASGLFNVASWRLRSESVRGLAMVHVGLPRLHGAAAAYKRAFDVVFSLAALTVLAPVLLLIGAVVKLDSRGPAIFRQPRTGWDHHLFVMLKFRSMTADAENRRTELLEHSDGNSVLFKMRQDPRVTRVGQVLRRFSLDELPQFLNVLRGDMSVVGPRLPLPSETEGYDDLAERRMTVKPGITGLWQVHGRSDLNWDDSLRLDLYYVENWSPSTDFRIVLRTLWAVFAGAGAY